MKDRRSCQCSLHSRRCYYRFDNHDRNYRVLLYSAHCLHQGGRKLLLYHVSMAEIPWYQIETTTAVAVHEIVVPVFVVTAMNSPVYDVPVIGVPEMGVPEMGVPDMGAPEMAVPEMAVPELAVPELAVPAVTVPVMTK